MKLSEKSLLAPQIRLCDIGKLYLELLSPWTTQSLFLEACLKMEHVLKPDPTSNRNKVVHLKPQDRLDLQVLNSLTHNSVPTTSFEDEKHDVTMLSSESRLRPEQDAQSALWEKYVREMSPFYFNLLSELLQAMVEA